MQDWRHSVDASNLLWRTAFISRFQCLRFCDSEHKSKTLLQTFSIFNSRSLEIYTPTTMVSYSFILIFRLSFFKVYNNERCIQYRTNGMLDPRITLRICSSLYFLELILIDGSLDPHVTLKICFPLYLLELILINDSLVPRTTLRIRFLHICWR
jgi:hypothetical protein